MAHRACGVGYVALSLAVLLLPQYAGKVRGMVFPALVGELALMLWLVIRGVNVEKWKALSQHAGRALVHEVGAAGTQEGGRG